MQEPGYMSLIEFLQGEKKPEQYDMKYQFDHVRLHNFLTETGRKRGKNYSDVFAKLKDTNSDDPVERFLHAILWTMLSADEGHFLSAIVGQNPSAQAIWLF